MPYTELTYKSTPITYADIPKIIEYLLDISNDDMETMDLISRYCVYHYSYELSYKSDVFKTAPESTYYSHPGHMLRMKVGEEYPGLIDLLWSAREAHLESVDAHLAMLK